MDDVFEIQKDFEQARIDLATARRKLVPKEIAYRNLDVLAKTVLARAFGKFEGPQEARKMSALASESYCVYLDGLAAARGEYLTWRAAVEVQQSKFDYCQSMLSFERAKLGIR